MEEKEEFVSIIDSQCIIDRFDLLRKFGNHYWNMQSRTNKYWAIPNLSEKICLFLIEFQQGKSVSFKQQVTSYAATEEFILLKQQIDTSVFTDIEMRKYLNSFVSKIEEIGEKGALDFEKMERICLNFKIKILTKQVNFAESLELVDSLVDNEISPSLAKNIDKLAITNPTILSILLYLGYTALCIGMRMNKDGSDGVPSCIKSTAPKSPDFFFGGKLLVKMD